MWISRVNFHRNRKQRKYLCNSGSCWKKFRVKGVFPIEFEPKTFISHSTATFWRMGIEEHRNTSKKQKTVQPTSLPWNHSNILSLSEIHADSFPVPLKQFSLQWNSLSSGGILSLQLQPTAFLAGHSRLNSREAGNMKSWDAWPDFKLNVVSSRIVTFK